MADIDINLRLQDRGIGRQLQNTERGINRANAALSSFIGNLASRVFVEFASQITQVFRGAIQAAQRQEAAIQRLNSALRNAGVTSVRASRQIQEFASQLQSVSRFGDEAAIEMTALAISMGATTEQATRVVAVAADLSEALGISLESAVRNVGRTLGGTRGELGELVPALRALTMAELQNGNAIAVLERLYGGTAREALDTFRGASDQAQNAIGDLSEAFGRIITQNPQVIQGLRSLTEFAGNLVAVIDRNRTAIITYVQALIVGTPAIVAAGTAFSGAAVAVRAFTIALLANPIIRTITIIGSLVGAVVLLNRAVDQTTLSEQSRLETAQANIAADEERIRLARVSLDTNRRSIVLNQQRIRDNMLLGESGRIADEQFQRNIITLRESNQETQQSIIDAQTRINQETMVSTQLSNTINLTSDLTELRRQLRLTTNEQQRDELLNSFRNQEAVRRLRDEEAVRAMEREAQETRESLRVDRNLERQELEITNFATNRERERQLVETGFMGRLMLISQFVGQEQALELAAEQRKINMMSMGIARDRAQNSLRLRINMQYLSARSRQEQTAADRDLRIRSGYQTAINNLLQAGLNFEDAGVRERKAFAIIQATINAYAGASRAFVDYPFPASVAVAGSVVAAGLAQVHNITNSGSFQQGGIIPGNSFSGDRLTANVNSGEMVLNRPQQQNLFNAINNGNFSANAGVEYRLQEIITQNQQPFVLQNADGRVLAEIVREGVRENVDLFA